MTGAIGCWVPEVEREGVGGGGAARAAKAVRLRIEKQGVRFFVSSLLFKN